MAADGILRLSDKNACTSLLNTTFSEEQTTKRKSEEMSVDSDGKSTEAFRKKIKIGNATIINTEKRNRVNQRNENSNGQYVERISSSESLDEEKTLEEIEFQYSPNETGLNLCFDTNQMILTNVLDDQVSFIESVSLADNIKTEDLQHENTLEEIEFQYSPNETGLNLCFDINQMIQTNVHDDQVSFIESVLLADNIKTEDLQHENTLEEIEFQYSPNETGLNLCFDINQMIQTNVHDDQVSFIESVLLEDNIKTEDLQHENTLEEIEFQYSPNETGLNLCFDINQMIQTNVHDDAVSFIESGSLPDNIKTEDLQHENTLEEIEFQYSPNETGLNLCFDINQMIQTNVHDDQVSFIESVLLADNIKTEDLQHENTLEEIEFQYSPNETGLNLCFDINQMIQTNVHDDAVSFIESVLLADNIKTEDLQHENTLEEIEFQYSPNETGLNLCFDINQMIQTNVHDDAVSFIESVSLPDNIKTEDLQHENSSQFEDTDGYNAEIEEEILLQEFIENNDVIECVFLENTDDVIEEQSYFDQPILENVLDSYDDNSEKIQTIINKSMFEAHFLKTNH